MPIFGKKVSNPPLNKFLTERIHKVKVNMDNERKYDGMLIVETSHNESESADFQTLGSVR